MKTYLVGGAVRDKLLGIPITDRDWMVVGATVEDMLARDFLQVGKDFPVFLHPRTREEYALARTERKTGPGHTGFRMQASRDVTLEDDLRRRDLTINAMAENEDGELIDPYHGARDIRDRKLRHVSPAFAEDPLRVLRVARFAARFAHLGFTVAEETLQLMKTISHSGELETLTAERIWRETQIALRERSPRVYFQTLQKCGALDRVMPELVLSPQNLDALRHAVELSPKGSVRFACLCHTLGGAATEHLCQRLRAPKHYGQLAVMTSSAHELCLRLGSRATGNADAVMQLLEDTDAFRRPDRFEHFLLACEAIARSHDSRRGFPLRTQLLDALRLARDIDSSDIIKAGFKGEEIGRELRQKRLSAIAESLGETNEP